MANIENKFEEPTKDNVEEGDFLVLSNYNRRISYSFTSLVKITKITKDRIEGEDREDVKSIRYADAIILKKNGKYLVGEFVERGPKF